MSVTFISSAVAWHSCFSRLSLSPANRVLTELVSKMKDMQMDKSELGCLRAIVLFNPGDCVASAVPSVGPQPAGDRGHGPETGPQEGQSQRVMASTAPREKPGRGVERARLGAGRVREGGRWGAVKRAVKSGQLCR